MLREITFSLKLWCLGEVSSQSYNITNFNKICVKSIKKMLLQNLSISMCNNDTKIYIHYFYINDMSFLLMFS
jgi:hypothetical protein